MKESEFIVEKPTFDSVWKLMQENEKRQMENEKQFEKFQAENDKMIKELNSQIGGLHNKFGSFTEGLFMPSIFKILQDTFNCSDIATNYKFRNNGDKYEIDLVGYSDKTCYIVEIKSHLREEGLEQLFKLINNFKKFSKKYAGENIYGILAATDYDNDTYQKVLASGFYFISTGRNIAELKVPDEFEPRIY